MHQIWLNTFFLVKRAGRHFGFFKRAGRHEKGAGRRALQKKPRQNTALMLLLSGFAWILPGFNPCLHSFYSRTRS